MRCCSSSTPVFISPIPITSLSDGARLPTWHADRLGLRLIEIERGQRPAPDTTAVEPEHSGGAVEAERGPVTKNDARLAAGAPGYAKPRQPGWSDRIRLALVLEVDATVGAAEAHAREH